MAAMAATAATAVTVVTATMDTDVRIVDTVTTITVKPSLKKIVETLKKRVNKNNYFLVKIKHF